MADYEIFREQLAIKYPSYGHALWEPGPINPNRPVQVGDVGFILEGRFHRLFSALLPADHPSQEFGVPEYHEPLVLTLSDYLVTGSLGRNNYCSVGVRAEADPGYHSRQGDFPQVLFRNETTRRAAVLSLPVTARRENTIIRNAFGRWMVKHIDTWFAFARKLGLVHQMGEIILVTGCDLTRSWTNIAFLGGWTDAQVSFGVEVEGPNTSINFQFPPERARGAVLLNGPEGTVRFYAIYSRISSRSFLMDLAKASQGGRWSFSRSRGHDSDSDMEVISVPAITQFRDPLHLLSDYIAEQASDCHKILVHDDDLLMIDGIGHGTSPVTLEPDVMVDLFRKSDIKIHKFGCDLFLTESRRGPNTDTSNVKVATLSTTFQNWNLTPPSQWPPLAAQKIDLSHTSELRGTPQPTIPGNSSDASVPTFQRASTKRKLSLLLRRDDSAPSTLQDLCDCAPPDRGQSAGHNYHEVSSGTGDPCCNSSSHMNATGVESGPGLWSTDYSESAGGHSKDVSSTGVPLIAYSNATPRGPSDSEKNPARCWTREISRMTCLRQVTIDMLPNDTLLKIFDFFVDDNDSIDAWHPLVHVCRKWRNINFESPRRLNLHLHFTGRPVRGLLDIWADLPIVVKLYDPTTWGVDNIVAALPHTDCVCEISLVMVAISPLQVIFAAMRVPFPALVRLKFLPEHETVPIAPNSFLGVSAPHLRSLYLGRVPFPGLPKLLLSATGLVQLTLRQIPHSGYISPEAMVTCLSTLTQLEFLSLDFKSPRPPPIQERGRPPPQTRSVLPALAYFRFRGVSEYLEDLMARIDAPLLDELHITFFYQLILDTPQLAQFISRTPNLKAHNEAQVVFFNDAVQVLLGSMQQVSMRTRCKPPDWQLSFMAQVCRSSLSLIPSLEHLYICEGKHSRSRWQTDIENDQWIELLHPFTTVKNLYLSKGIVPCIAPALQELVEEGGVTEVLPGLESLFLEGPHPSGPIDESFISKPVQEAIGMFIAARQLSSCPTNSRYWRGPEASVISQRFTGFFD